MPKFCDLCDHPIVIEQSFYHCEQCRDGDFDICEDCFTNDKGCLDQQHTLLHYRIRGDAFVDAESGRLIRYATATGCPGCSWEKSGRPHDDTQFRYETFPDGTYIRVLDLLPGTEDEPLRYSLHYARLGVQTLAQYVAVSYVCGDVKAKVASFCNGKRLDIYASLDQTLRRWRATPKQNPLRIWADAISINQQDNLEKSAQVARMHQIYRHANQIFVNLGDPPEGLDLALSALARASREFKDYQETQKTARAAESELGSLHRRQPRVTEISLDEAFAISRFANLTWWTRHWVVQEVCLWDVYTAYPPLFLCGDLVIQWLDLISAATAFGVAPPVIKDVPTVDMAQLRGTVLQVSGWDPPVVATFLEYYKVISKQGPSRNLHWFLQRTWKLHSTIPVDKVYGLLGLVREQYDVIHSCTSSNDLTESERSQKLDGRTQICVDYAVPFQHAYEHIARLTMKEESSLDILADAGSGRIGRLPQLPSWVPDWSNCPPEPALVSRLGAASSSKYNSSWNISPNLVDDGHAGLLEADAYFVARVHIEAGRYCGEADVIQATNIDQLQDQQVIDLKQHILSLWWCFGVKFNRYPTGERPFDVFWRTLIANRVTDDESRIVPSAAFVESFLLAHGGILEVEIKDEKPACICPEWAKVQTEVQRLRDDTHAEEEVPLAIRHKYPGPSEPFGHDSPSYGGYYNAALHSAAVGRRFFRTNKGYMGIGPKDLNRNDEVVILKGGPLPFLLRKDSTSDIDDKPVFTLLGEAYIHGLSEGEMLQNLDDPANGPHWKRIMLS